MSGNSGKSVRDDKAAMGVQPNPVKERDCKGKFQCRLMFIAYNLRRIVNILTVDVLKEYLKALASLYFDILGLIRGIEVTCDGILFHGFHMSVRNRLSLKQL
jgi:hypothetical protein